MKPTPTTSPEELLIRLSAAPRVVETITGERPAVQTIYRWTQRGLRGVTLRTSFAGGHRRTCERWIREFFAAVTAAADGETPPQAETSGRRAKEIAAAEQELRRYGI